MSTKIMVTRYVGLDVHTQSIAVCIMNATGAVLERTTIESRRAALAKWIDKAAFGAETRFALEALSPARWVLAEMLRRELDATLVHPYGVRLIVQSRKKSDRIDAYQLADLLRLGRLPKAYIATPWEQELRDLVRHRADIQARATRAKNQIHAILQERDEHCSWSDLFGKSGRRWLKSRKFAASTKLRVDHLLEQIDQAKEQVAATDSAVEALIADDPFVELLQTIPGVGVTLASIIRAEAGDVRRFDRPEQFAAYVGLVPATWESGGSRTSGGITKQGNRLLRYAFGAAVLHTCRWSAEWKERYAKLRRRIKKHKARVAMARRLAVVVWYMARSGEAFRFQERPPKAKREVVPATSD